MANNLTSTQKWNEKSLLEVRRIRTSLFLLHHGIPDGHPTADEADLEHHWYGVWNSALVELCADEPHLSVCPQPWISHEVLDNDDKPHREHLIPDFVLMLQREKENLIQAAVNRPLLIDLAQEWNLSLKEIISQIAVIVEIKRPDEEELAGFAAFKLGMMTEATKQLKSQIQTYFHNREWDKKAVIGMPIAGHLWSWKLFTPTNIGRPPLSDYKDQNWNQDFNDDRRFTGLCFDRRVSHENNREMARMLEAIYRLPGAERFERFGHN